MVGDANLAQVAAGPRRHVSPLLHPVICEVGPDGVDGRQASQQWVPPRTCDSMHDGVSPRWIDRVVRVATRLERRRDVERNQIRVIVDLVLDSAPGRIELGLVDKIGAWEQARANLAVPEADDLFREAGRPGVVVGRECGGLGVEGDSERVRFDNHGR